MSLPELIKEKAQQCVKCGICLPHCPTYLQTKHEGHSPRGRIALMEALAANNLKIDQHSENYLDHCLTCQACEIVCPADVQYGVLIDSTRALIHSKNLPSSISNKLPWWVHYLTQFKNIQRLLKISIKYFGSFILALMRLLQLNTIYFYHLLYACQQLLFLDSQTQQQKKTFTITASSSKKRIGLFAGCVKTILEANLYQRATNLLITLGYEVIQPPTQQCCGSLHLHHGEIDHAKKMAQANIYAFEGCDYVLYLNSGCGLTLAEYSTHTLLKNQLTKSSFLVGNILDFIADHVENYGWPSKVNFPFSHKRCQIHIPCSERQLLYAHSTALHNYPTQGIKRFLKLIPYLNLLNSSDLGCCGGAGVYFWQHQTMANALGQQFLKQLIKEKPDIILSSNIGCRLQLALQFSRNNIHIPLLHPLQLIS